MSLHNGTHRLASLGIIDYDLDHILASNLSNVLHKSICNVELLFVNLSTITEDKNIGLLSVMAMKLIISVLCASGHHHYKETPFELHVLLIGSTSSL